MLRTWHVCYFKHHNTVSRPSLASILSRSWLGGLRGVLKVWRMWPGPGTREIRRKAAEFRTLMLG